MEKCGSLSHDSKWEVRLQEYAILANLQANNLKILAEFRPNAKKSIPCYSFKNAKGGFDGHSRFTVRMCKLMP